MGTVVSSDGKTHPVKLKFTKCFLNLVMEDFKDFKDFKDLTMINVMVINCNPNTKFEMAGTLDMDIEGIKCCGEFGIPDKEYLITEGNKGWVFKNRIQHPQETEPCPIFIVAD